MDGTIPRAIEDEIRRVLATETRATVLCDRLFSQGTGLFSRLGATREERQRIAGTPLFQEAHSVYSVYRKTEAEQFAQLVEQLDRGRVVRTT